jgi:hypothetical protein
MIPVEPEDDGPTPVPGPPDSESQCTVAPAEPEEDEELTASPPQSPDAGAYRRKRIATGCAVVVVFLIAAGGVWFLVEGCPRGTKRLVAEGIVAAGKSGLAREVLSHVGGENAQKHLDIAVVNSKWDLIGDKLAFFRWCRDRGYISGATYDSYAQKFNFYPRQLRDAEFQYPPEGMEAYVLEYVR